MIPLRPVVDGVAWLEDQGVFVPVTTRVDYHSRWVSESAFPTLRVGQTTGPLSIVFMNTVSQPWGKGTLGQEARLGGSLANGRWAGRAGSCPCSSRRPVQT